MTTRGDRSVDERDEPCAAAELIGVTKVYRRRTRRRERRRTSTARGTTIERVALRECSLTVGRGETVAILGPNGAGKSTLVKLLLGQVAPDAGVARVFGGSAVPGDAIAAGRVGVAFQQPGLDKLLTARENLELQRRLFGMPRHDDDAAIRSLAERFGIADRLDDRVATLSGGLQRRVDLVRTLLTSPELLILDEPAAGLDIAARRDVATFVAQRRGVARDAAVIVTTHHAEVAEAADRLVMLRGGAVVAQGSADQLRERLLGDSTSTNAMNDAATQGANALYIDDASAIDETLTPAGVHITRTSDSRAVVTGQPNHLGGLAAHLTRSGTRFAVRPLSIDDLYVALAGAALTSRNHAANIADATDDQHDQPPTTQQESAP